jgi:putative hydrolase of the HAD superfamily
MAKRSSSGRSAVLSDVEAVFFDVGGTLVYGELGRADTLLAALRWIGYELTRDQVAQANRSARRAVSRRRRRYADRLKPAEASRMWLDHLAESLKLDLRGQALEAALDDATREIEARTEVMIDPDAAGLLSVLRSRGFRLGVISNWTRDLPEYLEKRGLAKHFDTIVASEAVGSSKPHREIFLRALSAVNCSPQRAVHVGDDYWADVVGARRLGIRAILVDREGDSPHDDCLVVGGLGEIRDLL